jgi:hypothetical protein
MGGAIGTADGMLYGSPHPKVALLVFNGVLVFFFIVLPLLFPRLQKYVWRGWRRAKLNPTNYKGLILVSGLGIALGVLAIILVRRLAHERSRKIVNLPTQVPSYIRLNRA